MVSIMLNTLQILKEKKCRGNVDLKRGKNVAVMSCEILQCRGNVFLLQFCPHFVLITTVLMTYNYIIQ